MLNEHSSKELRFTRARQAHEFWVAAAVLAMAAIVFFLLFLYRSENPELPSPWWGVAPLALAVGAAWVAVHCSRHAYLILTPIGLEIFPFFRPARGMQMISWAQIDSADLDDPPRRLTLHFNAEKSSGIHLSLTPIPARQRILLARAIRGRMEDLAKSREGSNGGPTDSPADPPSCEPPES